MVYLQRRGEWLYFRARVPRELRSVFRRAEVKVALRTRRYDIGKRMVKVLAYKTEELFTTLRENMAVLSEHQLKQLISDFFRRSLIEDEEARVDPPPSDRSRLW
jgi:hypothetical protein